MPPAPSLATCPTSVTEKGPHEPPQLLGAEGTCRGPIVYDKEGFLETGWPAGVPALLGLLSAFLGPGVAELAE